jgi:phage host-nuclease inhibitor protein Gam
MAEAEVLLATIANSDARIKQAQAVMGVALATVRALHEPAINDLARAHNAQRAALEEFAWANQKKEFAVKRSVDLLPGTMGFRWGKRSLEVLSKFTWATALAKIRARWPAYVRTVPEIDARAILDDLVPVGKAKAALSPATLAKMGLKVVRGESFYIELKS